MMKTLLLVSVLLLLGCSGADESGGSKERGNQTPEMPRFAEERLAKGRGVWMGTCRNCHLLGISGAPAVTDYMAWAPRIDKGNSALYRSALNGIKGEDGSYRMPPRGGNAQLKDEQVRQAVDYMLSSVRILSGQ
jgi:cytochrome c5